VIEIAFHDQAGETAEHALEAMINYTLKLWPDVDLWPDVPGGAEPRDVVLLEVGEGDSGSEWYGTVKVVNSNADAVPADGAEPYYAVVKRVEVY
jgi:hypothetical protein